MAKRLNVDAESFADYRGVPRGAAVLFTPHRHVGVRGGTSRDALTAASRRALAAQSEKIRERVKPIDGAHSQFVRHPSTDVLERELRAQAREKLRKDRKRHELTKKRKQVKETAASS